jgi:hypothetical protein
MLAGLLAIPLANRTRGETDDQNDILGLGPCRLGLAGIDELLGQYSCLQRARAK